MSISRRIVLNVDTTSKLKTLCKSHGVTVTQFVDSVLAVSHVEAALSTTKILSEQRFNMVVDLYEKATNWLVPLTMKDQVFKYLINIGICRFDIILPAPFLVWIHISLPSQWHSVVCC